LLLRVRDKLPLKLVYMCKLCPPLCQTNHRLYCQGTLLPIKLTHLSFMSDDMAQLLSVYACLLCGGDMYCNLLKPMLLGCFCCKLPLQVVGCHIIENCVFVLLPPLPALCTLDDYKNIKRTVWCTRGWAKILRR
jgi:hypothetical protein